MWSLLDRHLIVVGKKSGVVEQWDMRVSNTVAKPILTANTGTNHSIIDMEQNANNNLLMLASGSAVFAYTLDSLQLVRQFEMPAALSFKEEGGVTLRPDGAKFIAVSHDCDDTLWTIPCRYNQSRLVQCHHHDYLSYLTTYNTYILCVCR